jgi:hypothetical protein
MEKKRNKCRVLVGRPEGKRPLGRPGRRWEYNTKTDIKGIECEGVGWVSLDQKSENDDLL